MVALHCHEVPFPLFSSFAHTLVASPPVLPVPHLPTTCSPGISPFKLSLYPDGFLFGVLTLYYLRLRSLLVHGHPHVILPFVRLDFLLTALPFVSLFSFHLTAFLRLPISRSVRPRTV